MTPLRGVRVFSLLILFSLFGEYALQINPWPSPYYPGYPELGGYPMPGPMPAIPGFPRFPLLENSVANKVRVVGGRNATLGEIPYQVSIRLGNKNHNCGGCLIDKEWVLTAAHCLGPTSKYVTMGTIELNSGGITTGVSKFIKHPGYTQSSRSNDIGLLKLDKAVEFDQFIQPLTLPADDMGADSTLTLSGWGYLSYPNGYTPNNLQVLEVKSISNTLCSEKWAPYKIFPTGFCTIVPAGKGVCKGDSGGPLASNGEIHGIVSFGAACALGYPDVYTRVYSYKQWIQDTINQN
ncbi:chymotrypsin-2-like [Arctopsyche grandis]|uniref:chymotrypsin-2-like n=1 Tax=Arctopsyche grandis TaxID=121162 RepID=UPI00406D816C